MIEESFHKYNSYDYPFFNDNRNFQSLKAKFDDHNKITWPVLSSNFSFYCCLL